MSNQVRAGRKCCQFPKFTAVLLLNLAMACVGFAGGTPRPPKFRLSGEVLPERYHLDLKVLPDQDRFTGVVEIDLKFARAIQEIWLNASELEMGEATLIAGGKPVSAKVIATPKDYVGFAFGNPIRPGRAKLRVTYAGKISRKDMEGIFQVKDGDQWYLFSQYVARRVFPCFDEPNYKVPWQLSLHVNKEHVALSNTRVLSEVEERDGMKRVTFAETKPLPSYLVAFAAGPFEIVNAGTAGREKTQIRIVVPAGRSAEAQYAVESTPIILDLLEQYFGIPYPYEKLDEVAIPVFGNACENPGLVTYGAAGILSKPELDSSDRQRSFAWVCAHELAHMWFGNLVTMAWWDDTWLNEGFASWMENKIVEQFRPDWKLKLSELFLNDVAMEADGLVSVRKVREPICSNDDIRNAFDGTTYMKGSALLAMFENYMGRERFREGIRRYLLQYSWKNATTAEFLEALGGAQSIATAFSSFLDQPGVPLLSMRLDCGGSVPRLVLSQERFLPVGSRGPIDQTWQIPVCLRYGRGDGSARECTLLTGKSGEITLSRIAGCPSWLSANADAGGYYRVLYTGELLSGMLKDGTKALNLVEKVALIGNLKAVVSSGKMLLGDALALIPGLAMDPDFQVISKTMEISTGLGEDLVPENLLHKYRQYLSNLYGERAHQLGWVGKAGENDDTRQLRASLLATVANEAEDRGLIEQAKELTAQWFDNRQAIDPDIAGVVLATAARHGDRSLFDRFRLEAQREKDEGSRRRLLSAIGSFRSPEIIKAALPILLTDEFDIRESILILNGAAESSKTRDWAFGFVKENWAALVAKLPSDYVTFLPYIAAGYRDEKHRAEVESFFSGRSPQFTGGPRVLTQVLETITLQEAYQKTHRTSVVEFLKQY